MIFSYKRHLGHCSSWARTTMGTTTKGSSGYCSTWVNNLEPQCTTTLGAWVTVVLGLEIWGTTMSPMWTMSTYNTPSLSESFPPSLPGCGSSIFNTGSGYAIILGEKNFTQKTLSLTPLHFFWVEFFLSPSSVKYG